MDKSLKKKEEEKKEEEKEEEEEKRQGEGQCPIPPSKCVTDLYFWPEVRRHMEDGRGEDEEPLVLDVTCSICQENQLLFPAAVMGPGREPQAAVGITPCGHVFCFPCLHGYLRHQAAAAAAEPARCPLCRFDFARAACRHFVAMVELDAARPLADQVPRTLPEGGRVEPRCGECDFMWRKVVLTWEVVRLLFPAGCQCEASEHAEPDPDGCSHLIVQNAFDRFSAAVRETYLDEAHAKRLKW